MQIKRKLNEFQFIKYGERFDITIIDDVFPFYISPWRNTEYLSLADHFKIRIYSDGIEKNKLLPKGITYQIALKDFNKEFPQSKIYPRKLKLFSPINTELAYVLFFGYLRNYFKHIKKHNLNLVFNLYPGGGFDVNDESVKMFLTEVRNYNKLKGIFVNQKFTFNYLVNELKVPQKLIVLANEPILPNYYHHVDISNKRWYKIHKGTFDVAFVANKYMPKGIDKGFDVFLDYSEILSRKYDFVRFHIVGGFTKEDITQNINTTNFTFYGYSDFEFFKKFYAEIDLFISPNKPFAKSGIFDGFPLGTSLEAGICGAVVMMSDLLNENEILVDDHDFLLINNEIEDMIRKTERLISNPEIMQSFVVNFRESIFKFSNNNIALTKKINFFNYTLQEIK